MEMHKVFNNTIGSPYDLSYPNLSAAQEQEILAGLFEQLLIFDRITITTGRLNFPLFFLIKHLGINKVEEMIERNAIEFLLWSPMIFTGRGRQREDGTTDESVIYGQLPIVGGSLGDQDIDPGHNIDNALNLFNLNRERKRIFKRIAEQKYTVAEGLQNSSASVRTVMNAYLNNDLASLGLAFEKDPAQLSLQERDLMLDVGSKLLETTLLSRYNLKSYENYAHYQICEQNLANIGNALKVSENTSQILKIENIPDLKSLFKDTRMSLDDVLTLRYKGNAKYYRKWINEVSDSSDAQEITKEYLNELKDNSNFFNTNPGKFVRNIGVWGVSTYLGNLVAGDAGVMTGVALGLADTFWLESIIKGRNPSMFIQDIEQTLAEANH
jgi:hypothetical protein